MFPTLENPYDMLNSPQNSLERPEPAPALQTNRIFLFKGKGFAYFYQNLHIFENFIFFKWRDRVSHPRKPLGHGRQPSEQPKKAGTGTLITDGQTEFSFLKGKDNP